jgi:hypothetical protein
LQAKRDAAKPSPTNALYSVSLICNQLGEHAVMAPPLQMVAHRIIPCIVTVGLGGCDYSHRGQEFARKRKLLFASIVGNQSEVTDPV